MARKNSKKHPIYSVPEDVFLEIFSHLVFDKWVTKPTIVLGSDVPRGSKKCRISFLSASHVNRYWRDIIHSSSSFWTRLLIDGRVIHTMTPMIRWILKKSGTSPLYVTMHRSYSQYPKALTLFFGTSIRWEALDAVISSDSLHHTIRDNLPVLRNLRLSIPGYADDITVFRNAPSLTTLTLLIQASAHLLGLDKVDIPWQQLSELTLRPQIVSQTIQALSKCINLVSLTLQLYGSVDAESGTSNSPIIYPKLQTLNILFAIRASPSGPVEILSSLFQAISLPSLTGMTVSEQDYGFDWPMHQFQQLQARSNFRLSSLTIATRDASISDLPILFGLVPSIRQLEVHRYHRYRSYERDEELERELLRCLTVPNSAFNQEKKDGLLTDITLPQLEDLTFITSTLSDINLLSQLLSSRSRRNPFITSNQATQGVTLLKRVLLRTKGDPRELFKSLQDLRESELSDIRIAEESRAWNREEWYDEDRTR